MKWRGNAMDKLIMEFNASFLMDRVPAAVLLQGRMKLEETPSIMM